MNSGANLTMHGNGVFDYGIRRTAIFLPVIPQKTKYNGHQF
jgi:hypothetical protein